MVSVNLIPATVQATRARQRHLKLWGVMVMASAALLSVPLGMDWYQSARAVELRRMDESLQDRLVNTRADLRTQTATANELLLQLNRAKALRSKRAWSGLIGLVGRCMPRGCWLTSIATDPGAPVGGPHRRQASTSEGLGQDGEATVTIEAPRKIRLAGYASDAAEPHIFVASLKATEVFSQVTLERSQREPVLDGYYFLFELVCEW